MRDFRAGRLKRFKHETSFFQRPSRFQLGFVLRTYHLKYTVPFFLLGDH